MTEETNKERNEMTEETNRARSERDTLKFLGISRESAVAARDARAEQRRIEEETNKKRDNMTVEDYVNAITEAHQNEDFNLVLELWAAAQKSHSSGRNHITVTQSQMTLLLHERVESLVTDALVLINGSVAVKAASVSDAITDAYDRGDYLEVSDLWNQCRRPRNVTTRLIGRKVTHSVGRLVALALMDSRVQRYTAGLITRDEVLSGKEVERTNGLTHLPGACLHLL